MSQKTAEEEERYMKEMEKYTVAFVGRNVQCVMCVCDTSSFSEGLKL